MQKEFEEKLVNYLKKNGVEEIPSDNKQLLALLDNIAYNKRVDIDFLEIEHNKVKSTETEKDRDNYVKSVQNLEIDVHNAEYYMANIRGIIKQEKRLKRKKFIKKLFKK